LADNDEDVEDEEKDEDGDGLEDVESPSFAPRFERI
jgi:hypothetical protein